METAANVRMHATSSRQLKRVFETVGRVVEDVVLEFSTEGLSFASMCSAHVSLCTLNLSPNAFERYSCRKPVAAGVVLKQLNQILATIHDRDPLTILIYKEDDSMIVQSIGGSSGRRRDVSAKLCLTTITNDIMEVPPSIVYNGKVVVNSAELERSLRDLSHIGQICHMTIDSHGLGIGTSGDVGEVKLRLNVNSSSLGDENDDDDDVALAWDVRLAASSHGEELNDFALVYLNRFARASCVSDAVQISMSANTPLRLCYLLQDDRGGGQQRIGALSFYLAPREVADQSS